MSRQAEEQRLADDGTVSVVDDVQEIARMRNEPIAEALVTIELTSVFVISYLQCALSGA